MAHENKDENKLTDEQVENWRKILAMTLGPYAYMMPKADVQKMRDKMQSQVDKDL
jgi:hypothetical protein